MEKCLIQCQTLPGCHREQLSGVFLSLFADDCVLYRYINSKLDCLELQQALQKLVDWSRTWKVSFNINKCHTLHAHRKKQSFIHTYIMDNTLPPVESEQNNTWVDRKGRKYRPIIFIIKHVAKSSKHYSN